MSEKVTSIGKTPDHVRPEMVIRWLMSQMDQIDQLIVVAKSKGAGPMVSVSDGTSPYLIAMGAALLHDMALDKMEPVDPHEPPKASA